MEHGNHRKRTGRVQRKAGREATMIVVATKLDATTDRTRLEEITGLFVPREELEFHAVSSRVRRRDSATGSSDGRCTRPPRAPHEPLEEAEEKILDAAGTGTDHWTGTTPKPNPLNRRHSSVVAPRAAPQARAGSGSPSERGPLSIGSAGVARRFAGTGTRAPDRAFRRHVRSYSHRPSRRGARSRTPLPSG